MTTEQKNPVIRLENLSYAYPAGPPVIRELNFSLYPEDRIGLVAPNGCGKTTLFHLIMGLLKPSAGSVVLFGQRVCEEREFAPYRSRIGLLFQDPDDQLFSPTVMEDVAFGPLNSGKSKEEALEISSRTLHRLGLDRFEDRITHKLSGGEKRLVSLATVLSMAPEALLLDEPTGGLDDRTKEKLAKILPSLGLPYIVISHKFDFLSATADQMVTMEGGKILLDKELHFHHHEHAHILGKKPHRHI